MTLLAEAVELLRQRGAPHAMIGATALAVLGSSRSTQDLDVLTTDRAVLELSCWSGLTARGAEVEVRIGDSSDPLVGVVRITRDRERPVDIIVGEAPWQDRVLAESPVHAIADIEVPVVDRVGFILLKVYAGGPQDLWDVEQLLAITSDRQALTATVDERVADLPPRCRDLWRRITRPDER